jgi:hypothetical protein
MVRVVKAGAAAEEVRRSVCLATDPTDSIGRLLKDYLNASIANLPTSAEIWAEVSRTLTALELREYIISDDVLHSHDAEVNNPNTTYAKFKTITLDTLISRSLNIRTYFELKCYSAYAVYGRVYKNGAAFGTERSTSSTTYVSFTEDLGFKQGEICELWLRASTAGTSYAAYARNFRILGRENTVAQIADPFSATNT